MRYYKPDNVKTRFIKMTLLFLRTDFAMLEMVLLIWMVALWAGQAREEWDAIISSWEFMECYPKKSGLIKHRLLKKQTVQITLLE